MEAMKLLVTALNQGTANLGISGSPTSNQSRLRLPKCVSGASAAHATAKIHVAQRACSHLCSASPGAGFSVLHLPESQHKVCPLCSRFQGVSNPSTEELQRFLSLRCLQPAPMLCSCLGAQRVCFFSSPFPL